MILVVKSSGRSKGKSNQIIDQIAKHFETKIYDLNKLNLKGCIGCRACKTKNTYCIIKDDLKSFWTDLEMAEGVLIGSPNYMGSMNGQLKLLYDRLYCLTDIGGKNKMGHLKSGILIFAQGYSNEAYYQAEYEKIRSIFSRQMNLDMDLMVYGGDENILDDSNLQDKIDWAVGKLSETCSKS